MIIVLKPNTSDKDIARLNIRSNETVWILTLSVDRR